MESHKKPLQCFKQTPSFQLGRTHSALGRRRPRAGCPQREGGSLFSRDIYSACFQHFDICTVSLSYRQMAPVYKRKCKHRSRKNAQARRGALPGETTTQPPRSCWCIHALQPRAPFSPARGSPLSQKGSKNSTCSDLKHGGYPTRTKP